MCCAVVRNDVHVFGAVMNCKSLLVIACLTTEVAVSPGLLLGWTALDVGIESRQDGREELGASG